MISRSAVGALGVAGTLIALTPAAAEADIISTFDTDDEGWRIVGDAQDGSASPDYAATDGNPGGHISATDDVRGGTWYFQAPEKFHGNRAAAYGTDLTFDLRQSSTSSPFDNDDIVLTGGGKTIVFDTANNPGTDWTSYSVRLDDTAGWTLNTRDGASATAADIQAVLADLTRLRIRGEYRSGPDTGGLDNVHLVPEPATAAMLGIAGLVLASRRRGSR